MTTWIEQLDHWNPQFLRECRGRLKPRSVLAAVVLSTIFQVLLGLFVSQGLSYLEPQEQWLRICKTLIWCIPYALFVIGSYYLVSDLTQEEKRGTLNFIRLSPRPAHEILLGKLLGVPILPYLLVASAVPLQVVSALMGGVSLWFELSYYLVLVGCTVLVFSLAMLTGLTSSRHTMLVGQQAPTAIAYAGLVLFFFAPTFMLWNQISTWYALPGRALLFGNDNWINPIEWLYLPISSNSWVAHGFVLVNLAIGISLVWQTLKRQFRNPLATLMSKRLSYLTVAYLNGLLWGFFQIHNQNDLDKGAGLIALYALNFCLFLLLYFSLSPQRQMLLDWRRYHAGQSSLDWVWGDKSPAVVAIAINILIAAALIIPTGLTQMNENLTVTGFLLAVLSVGLNFLTYATLVQIIFSLRIRNPYIWGVGVLATVIVVPIIVLAIFQISPEASPGFMTLWTFLGYPFWDLTQPGILAALAGGVIMQILVLASLVWCLLLSLKTLGNG